MTTKRTDHTIINHKGTLIDFITDSSGVTRYRLVDYGDGGQELLIGPQLVEYPTEVRGYDQSDTAAFDPTVLAPSPPLFVSDGEFVNIFRIGNAGDLYVNRVVLNLDAMKLAPKWEVRFQLSGDLDTPKVGPDDPNGEGDTLDYVDESGLPFIEPIIHLSAITGIQPGWMRVEILPTSVPGSSRWWFAYRGAQDSAIHASSMLHDRSRAFIGALDDRSFSVDGHALDVAADGGLASAVYGEQVPDPEATGGDAPLIQGLMRVLLVFPVIKQPSESRLCVVDMHVDEDGIPKAPQGGISLQGPPSGDFDIGTLEVPNARALYLQRSSGGAVFLRFLGAGDKFGHYVLDTHTRTWSRPGFMDRAFVLGTNVDSQVELQGQKGIDLGADREELTIMFWWYPYIDSQEDAIVRYELTLTDGYDPDRSTPLSSPLRISGPTDLRFDIGGSATIPLSGVHGRVNIRDGLWHHVAATWRRDTAKISLYVDGGLVAEGETATNAVLPRWGRLKVGGGGGQVCDFSVWDKAMDADEIEGRSASKVLGTEPGLRLSWPFDDVVPLLADASGHQRAARVGANVERGDFDVEDIKGGIPLGVVEQMTTVEYGWIHYTAQGEVRGLQKLAVALDNKIRGSVGRDTRLDFRLGAGNLSVEKLRRVLIKGSLVGYVEGAPPVPSENLTNKKSFGDRAYEGAAAVSIIESGEASYYFSAARDVGLDMSIEALAGMSLFGTGGGIKAKLNLRASWLENLSAGDSQLIETIQTQALLGAWEGGPPLNPTVGARWLPNNTGTAYVRGVWADVYALRHERTGALAGYAVVPAPNTPPVFDLVPFKLNPAYVKNGSLDGNVGSIADPTVGGGPSYFRPEEHLELTRKIAREQKQREAFYRQYPAGKKARMGYFSAIDGDSIEDIIDDDQTVSDWATELSQRDIVNSYIWTSDGAFHAERTHTAQVREQSTGGAFSMLGAAGISAKGGSNLEVLAGSHLDVTVMKKKGSTYTFGLEGQVTADGNDVKDADDAPRYPGEKVDRYRFSTFYLAPRVESHTDFFARVVDPAWLATTNNDNVKVLASLRDRPTDAWRVRHIVTYVSRAGAPDRGQSDPAHQTRSTPIDLIVLGSSSGRLYALEPDGRQRWMFQGQANNGFGSGRIACVGGTVYAVGNNPGTVVALDARTGEERWSVGDLSDQGAVEPAVVGDTLYCAFGSTFYALDRASGAMKWSHEGLPAPSAGNMSIVDGKAWLGTSRGLYRVDTSDHSGSLVAASDVVLSVEVVDDDVYFVSSRGLHAVTKDGGELWTRTAPAHGRIFAPRGLLARGHYAVHDWDAKRVDVDALDTGSTAFSFPSTAPSMLSPDVVDGELYMMDRNAVVHVDLATGAQKQRFLVSSPTSGPRGHSGWLYLGTSWGVVGIDTVTGRCWRTSVDGSLGPIQPVHIVDARG